MFVFELKFAHGSVSLAVCEPGVPDDISDGHVSHSVSKTLSSGAAAPGSLLCVLLSRPPTRHRGESSHCSLPERLVVLGQFTGNKSRLVNCPRTNA